MNLVEKINDIIKINFLILAFKRKSMDKHLKDKDNSLMFII